MNTFIPHPDQRRLLWGVAVLFALGAAAGCGAAPVVTPTPPPVSHELKMAWILRLEDVRVLSEPLEPAAAPPVQAPPRRGAAPVLRAADARLAQ